ncbi:MAG: topoisomerase-4 subunit A [Parvicellaceae bacterium]|jgi:topoisomerase-4 subunit A
MAEEKEEPIDDNNENADQANDQDASSDDGVGMSESGDPSENGEVDDSGSDDGDDGGGKIIPLSGMYEDWFLDYASYVILERAVPALNDGLKPVQRRILHSLKELDDGRYNKVANVIGNTMKYHPHGDQSIGDAMVQIGQKDIIIDTQGNWGNTLTGDRAAAPRYIEARLTKFALHTSFNAKTTDWLSSYDGRNKEPEHLPIKFPLLLAQGTEGIAVGLACKMLPHNFNELIDGSIDVLRGKKPKVIPDFPNGGTADVSNYNDGLRGGKVRVRAKLGKVDQKTLAITEIPYATTTDSLIASILKANDKGKIKIKKIEDNTSATAEIIIHLPPGVSPDKMIDALFAFTDCEISISPNACVIFDDRPVFMGVTEILRCNTQRTLDLLKLELEIRKAELQEQWHFASLERIFIENRIYRDIEEAETWEAVIEAIDLGLHKFISTPGRKGKGLVKLHRDLTEEDIVRLTEIKIKRISKFDSFKADEQIQRIEDNLVDVQNNLDNLVEYAIQYFKDLKDKFGEGRERRTELKTFDNVSKSKVIVSNKKLYVNKEEGFIGWSLKKDEFIEDCSEIDDVIVIFDTGKLIVTKITDKKFLGKGIVHVAVWKKGDKRTIYHMLYQDGKGGSSYMKRFFVNSITRDKEYDLTNGAKGSKVHYFSCNLNGRKEVVTVNLRPRPHLKRAKFDVDFSELMIKGRASKGNRATKDLISKVIQKEVGGSTLAARKVWWDEVVQRLNDQQRGTLLGDFRGEDRILTIYKGGYYRLTGFELSMKFDEDLVHIEKWYPDRPIASVYWDASKEIYYIKRFLAETSTKKVEFVPEGEGNEMTLVTTDFLPKIKVVYNKHLKSTKHLPDKVEEVNDFIEIKGLKAQGNQLTKLKVKDVELMPMVAGEEWPVPDVEEPVIIEAKIEEVTAENVGGSETEEIDVIEESSEVENEVVEKPIKPAAKKEVAKPNKAESGEDSQVVGSTENDDSVTFTFDGDDVAPTDKPENKKKGPIQDPDEDDEGQITLF